MIDAAAGVRLPVKNGTNVRKHGISLGRFGDMDFEAALVAEDVTHSTATETRWIYLGLIDGVLHVAIVTIATTRRESSAYAARAALNGNSVSKQSDDPENPQLGADFFARAQRGLGHVPRPMRTALLDEQTRRRGRGPQRTPTKKLVSLRLDPDVVIAYRKTGRGWQGRINAVLRKTVRTRPTPHVAGSVVEAAAPTGRHAIARKAAKKR